MNLCRPPNRVYIWPIYFTVFPALCIQFDFSTFRLFKGARNPLVKQEQALELTKK
jgi:hypothetical protein